jgi:prepilin-type processing-associated H-X9-DG protein
MYVQDYDETMVHYGLALWGGGGGSGTIWKVMWLNATHPYVKNEQIRRCPSDPGQQPCTSFCGSPGYGYNWTALGCSYCYPYRGNAPCRRMNVTLGNIPNPADIILLADSNFGVPSLYPTWCLGSGYEAYNGSRHSGGANIAFLDGHAKWHRSPQWMYNRRMWVYPGHRLYQ